jgi:hypothetical protein
VLSHFSLVTAVLLCLLGFGIGVFGTLVGVGGGFILTPVRGEARRGGEATWQAVP